MLLGSYCCLGDGLLCMRGIWGFGEEIDVVLELLLLLLLLVAVVVGLPC